MSILEVKNLKKNFGSLEVLKGIDFSLEKGDVYCFVLGLYTGQSAKAECGDEKISFRWELEI